jgi:hypothetical protein
MREFTETDLKQMIAAAGFTEIRIHAEDDADYGILHQEAWSLPITARKGPAALRPDVTRELLSEWGNLNARFHHEMARLNTSLWFRVGRKLGLI